MIELRDEHAAGPASRALFEQYLQLVRERSGIADFAPLERIFATEDVFSARGAAWLVAYRGGQPVGCGGLRTLAPGIGEIKRMFVAPAARRSGVGRLLLRTLEQRAAAAGHTHVRLLATPMLGEAMALYEAERYVEIERIDAGGGAPVEVWMEKALG